jgi:hypothetical protein
MGDVRNTARMRFAAALALFLLWVAALVAMAVLSSSRPRANRAPSGLAKVPPIESN